MDNAILSKGGNISVNLIHFVRHYLFWISIQERMHPKKGFYEFLAMA